MIILDYKIKESTGELWQYDYGETLRIQGGNLQKAQEVHFSLSRTGGDSVTRIGVTKDDATDVVIPDSMLENNDSEIDYLIYVFLYNRDSASGETTKRFALSVQSRPKPEHSGGEDGNIFGQVIEEVRKSAESAEMAKKKAAEYAEQTKEDAQNTAEDRKEVERLVDSVKDIDEQVETIKTYKEQAQTSATNALLSEQNTKKAEQSALQARAGAETAENSAEQHATQVRGDKAEVERLSTQVREDKASVEQTTQDFDLKAQQSRIDEDEEGQTADGYTLYVKIEKEKARNVEEFKQWLLENPLTVLYVLDEPVIEELPEEVKQQLSALQTYYPTTIVMNDANAEMEVTYVADTKNYIDNKLKELVTANMQNTANLLSLMPISVQAEMIENDTNRILEEVTQ